jgi:hypothetical protein
MKGKQSGHGEPLRLLSLPGKTSFMAGVHLLAVSSGRPWREGRDGLTWLGSD